MSDKMKQRDDAVAFVSRWTRGEKRYLLSLGFPLTADPMAALPPGVSWDHWYEKPYLLLQLAVLSGQKRWGGIVSHKSPRPMWECLAPVRSADGKPGWYRFFAREGLKYRVQFFPEKKSSRSEIEFTGLCGGNGEVRAATHGGAMSLAGTPEAAYCFSRGFYLEPQRKGVSLTVFEHQNRMAWEAEELSVTLPNQWWPDGVTLERDTPEFAYLGKGSPFASSFPRRIA